jgi:ankyrin repeat protein
MGLCGNNGLGSTGRGCLTAALVAFSVAALLGAAMADLFDLAETGTSAQLQQAIKGADVNSADSVGRTLLMHAAAYNPDPHVIGALVAAGAKVNARGPNGWTALMMAAYNNPNPAVVEALLTAGANGRLRSLAGETAFDYAANNDKVRGSSAYAKLRTAAR